MISRIGIQAKSIWNYSVSMMETFRKELTVSPEEVRRNPTYVMARNESILGYYSLEEVDEQLVELKHLFVDPGQLRLGYGTSLFQHSLQTAKTAGYKRLVIQCDPNAVGFYQKLGYEPVKVIPSSIPGRSIPCFELNL